MKMFQQKVLTERTVFLSYSRRDRRLAASLESELEARKVHVYRHATSLRAGEEWEAALGRALHSADCVLVLVSPAAASSDWVKCEERWATDELAAGGLVERILPLEDSDCAMEEWAAATDEPKAFSQDRLEGYD